jgi:transcriptional regulator with XRE-family HTH domain
MSTAELLRQLRAKGWSDAEIGAALGMSVPTIFRWRAGQMFPRSEGPVNDALRRLLRRQGPPRKGLAGNSPARPLSPALVQSAEPSLV